MWKRRGAATSSPDSAGNWGHGAWRNIWRRSRCSSTWMKIRLAGTENFRPRSLDYRRGDVNHENDSDAHGNTRPEVASLVGAPRIRDSAGTAVGDTDFCGKIRGRV